MKRALACASIGLLGSLGALLLMSATQGTPSPVPSWLRGWPGFAHGWRHAAQAPYAAQALQSIHWQTPVDLAPQYSGNDLFIHYGSPLITARNNVLVTVKTGAYDGFQVECHRGSDGLLLWTEALDYSLPPHNWVPSCGPTLTPANQAVMPAAGGTVLRRASADRATSSVQRNAFYGLANYNAAPATYDANVKINTPLTCDREGNVYFGFLTLGPTPAGLSSGIARLDAAGNGSWISAASAAGDASIQQVVTNCAPALANDGAAVYVGVRDGGSTGYLLRLDSTTLVQVSRVRLKDPLSGLDAYLFDDGTASPTVAPDGDVFYGTIENPFYSNHFRGWMLHYDDTLATTRTPGAFGWDNTAAIVPASAVPSYSGTSSYLLLTKYNNYAQAGGDGVNKVAVLDPTQTQLDPISGATTLKEILVKAGPTPDPPNQGPGSPNAVREWCINTAAVDRYSKCALVNNEDGKLYRWDFASNTLSEVVTLTVGIGEAYTPTCVGPDGTVYAINNATLFAVGQ